MQTIITKQEWIESESWEKVIEGRIIIGEEYPFQVTQEIYDDFLSVLPPEEMGVSREILDYSFGVWKIKGEVTSYFLVGEARDMVNGVMVYDTFAICGGRYYYIGTLKKQ